VGWCLYVAVSSDGTDQVMVSGDSYAWTLIHTGHRAQWSSVTYNAVLNLWAAIASDESTVFLSP
jgi:hypothetical protein